MAYVAPTLDASALTAVLNKTSSCWAKGVYSGSNVVSMRGYSTLKSIDEQETRVAEAIMEHVWLAEVPHISSKLIDKYIDEFIKYRNHGYKLHIHQREAVHMAVNSPIFLLIGGPGTGKTTTLNCISYVLRRCNKSIEMKFTAPTGKAARRVNESTGEKAKTFHSEMHIFDEDATPIDFKEDMLVIDEVSMMDLNLTDKLFKAVKSCKRIALVGDDAQLPSVGKGTILRDLIRSKLVPMTRLTKTFRQDDSSTLYANIKNVAEGIPKLIAGSDFAFECLNDKTDENSLFLSLGDRYFKAVEKYGIENVVLLLPYRKFIEGKVTAETMNNTIHALLWKGKNVFKLKHIKVVKNKSGKITEQQTRYFCKNDYVMQLENRAECSNGEVGKIINLDDTKVVVDFGKRPGEDKNTLVTYKINELDQLTLAYAMSVNKSQGSEYACVIMCLLNSHTMMLNRNILYTGITRAKKECQLVYQLKAFNKAVKTLADENRYSMLVEKMIALNCGYKAEMAVNRMYEYEMEAC